MNCQDNSRLKVPLPEVCKTTDIGCVPITDGKPECPPEADQLPFAYDINSKTLWIFSCESREWTPFTKSSLAELDEVSLDNIKNICSLVNVPVFYNLGYGTTEGSMPLGEFAKKIVECGGGAPTPTPSVDSKTVVAPGENVTVTSATVGDTTTYTVNAVIPTPSVDKNDITVVEAGSNVSVTSSKVGDTTTYTVSATGGGGGTTGSVIATGNFNIDTAGSSVRLQDISPGPHGIFTAVYDVQRGAIVYGNGELYNPHQGQINQVKFTNPFSTESLYLINYRLLLKQFDLQELVTSSYHPRIDIYAFFSDEPQADPTRFGINTERGFELNIPESAVVGITYSLPKNSLYSSNTDTIVVNTGNARIMGRIGANETKTLYFNRFIVLRSATIPIVFVCNSFVSADLYIYPDTTNIPVTVTNWEVDPL